MNLILRTINYFSKWSRPKPKLNKLREQKKSLSLGDEKAAKLSKSQQQLENKQKLVEEEKIKKQTEKNIQIYKRQDESLDELMSQKQLNLIYQKQLQYLKSSNLTKNNNKPLIPMNIPAKQFQYLPTQTVKFNKKQQKYQQKKPPFGNYVKAVNKQFTINPIEEPNEKLRRVGCLGVKLGMITLWDRWGHRVPATVIEVDRVQVIQIKDRFDGFKQVQMGIGSANYKRLTKPLLGHYIKAKVPPKRKLAEFKVSPECLLPVGYMMSVRHYTPGMFVDVQSKTVGHGFSGTIKRYGFRRQPETHGNSLTTRVLGSTGQRQDPGRVFKQKKMYGHMGGKVCVQAGMEVYKIDVDRNLIYLYGSVPGKAGTIVKIRDTLVGHKAEKNMNFTGFPTFIQKPGVKYARQLSRYSGERDPDQIQIHDNAYIVDDGEDDTIVTTTSKQIPED